MSSSHGRAPGAGWGDTLWRALQQQSPSEWPQGLRRAGTAGVATAVCGAGLWLSGVAGDWQSWRADEQRREALQAQRAQLADDLARWRRDPSLGAAAPSPTPQALRQAWTEAAAQPGWTVDAAQPQAEADGGTTLRLQWQGPSTDGPRWWAQWSALAPAVTLQRWQIEALSPQRVRVEVVAAWTAPHDDPAPLPAETTPEAAGALPATDPFSVQAWVQRQWQHAQRDARVAQWLPRWQRAPAVLTQARDSDVHYRGRMQSPDREVALVQIAATDPDNAVSAPNLHAVALGDALGPDLGRVVHIDDQHLVLQQWRRDTAGVWHAHTRALPREDAAPVTSGARP